MNPSLWLPHTPALQIAELPDILAQNPVVILHFWAIWDLHDRTMDAYLQEVIPQFEKRIAFYSVNVDEESNHELCRQCHILSIPALGCFVKGEWYEASVGVLNADKLILKLDSWLSVAE